MWYCSRERRCDGLEHLGGDEVVFGSSSPKSCFRALADLLVRVDDSERLIEAVGPLVESVLLSAVSLWTRAHASSFRRSRSQEASKDLAELSKRLRKLV